MIEIEYRAVAGPGGIVHRGTCWRATCPGVPEFRARTEKRLFLAKGAALSELDILGVDEEAAVTHVLVDSDGSGGDGERFGLEWPVKP